MKCVFLRYYSSGPSAIFAKDLLSYAKITKFNFCKFSGEPKITLADIKFSHETKNIQYSCHKSDFPLPYPDTQESYKTISPIFVEKIGLIVL